jgi:hypothetical protein
MNSHPSHSDSRAAMGVATAAAVGGLGVAAWRGGS